MKGPTLGDLENRLDDGEFKTREDVVESLPDEMLWQYHTAFSNTKVIIDTVWLPLIEAELRRRNLIHPS